MSHILSADFHMRNPRDARSIGWPISDKSRGPSRATSFSSRPSDAAGAPPPCPPQGQVQGPLRLMPLGGQREPRMLTPPLGGRKKQGAPPARGLQRIFFSFWFGAVHQSVDTGQAPTAQNQDLPNEPCPRPPPQASPRPRSRCPPVLRCAYRSRPRPCCQFGPRLWPPRLLRPQPRLSCLPSPPTILFARLCRDHGSLRRGTRSSFHASAARGTRRTLQARAGTDGPRAVRHPQRRGPDAAGHCRAKTATASRSLLSGCWWGFVIAFLLPV